MRIIDEVQLDFDDVLIRPARSDFKSRSEANIFRTFEKNGRNTFTCIPICCANMDSIAMPRMARIFVNKGLMCAMEKHIPYDDLEEMYSSLSQEESRRIALSIGVNDSLDTIRKINSKFGVNIINIDVANGYATVLQDKVKEVRSEFPNAWIIAGTVVTGDIVTDLLNCGADIIRCGIGGGCFLGDMKVLTNNGLKKIQDISVGDKVLTHSGNFESVVNKFEFSSHKKIIDINGIKCTPNHKFYVAKVEDLDKITESNYQDYCIWIEAKDLDESKYKLVKITYGFSYLIEFIDIKKSEIMDNDRKTYDLEVEHSHSYNIEGIIVHNSMCLTRRQTGVGRPMVSMLEDCSDAAHQIHGYVMSDGGCKCPGDICKALGCSDFVMVGSMFAGAEEATNGVVEINGERYKRFAGMSSSYAQNKLFGGFKSQYRSSEGRQTLIKIKGSLSDIIDDILGGLRSCFTYIGCHNMKHFQKHCVFYRVNHQLTTTYENAPTFKE